jgi:hypothetical protein
MRLIGLVGVGAALGGCPLEWDGFEADSVVARLPDIACVRQSVLSRHPEIQIVFPEPAENPDPVSGRDLSYHVAGVHYSIDGAQFVISFTTPNKYGAGMVLQGRLPKGASVDALRAARDELLGLRATAFPVCAIEPRGPVTLRCRGTACQAL